MKKNYVDIVLTSDKNYVIPLSVAMTSIVHNLHADRTARFFLLVSGFGDEQIDQVRQVKNCKIEIIPVERHMHWFEGTSDISKYILQYIKSLAPYYRLLIPKILPNHVDKVIYFDGDMIADSDLSVVYDQLPKKKLLSAVVEIWAMKWRESILGNQMTWTEFKKLKETPMEAPYFNSGFFVMNLKLAREMNIFREFIKFLKKHQNPPYPDQDTINAVIGQEHRDLLVHLPPEYNVFCDIDYNANFSESFYPTHKIQRALSHPLVLHYAGSNKPWITRQVPHFYHKWWDYADISPFHGLKEPQLPMPVPVQKTYNFGKKLNLLKVKTNGDKAWTYLFGIKIKKGTSTN